VIRKLLYRNFLILYRTGQWIRRHFTHAGMLVLAGLVASAIFGLNIRQTLAYQIFLILFSVLLMSVISVVVFRGKFRFRRILPEYGTAGEKLEYGIQIENLTPQKYHTLTLMDELESSLPSFEQFRKAKDTRDEQRNFFDRIVGYPRLVSLIRKVRGGQIAAIETGSIAGKDRILKKITLLPLRRGYLRFASLAAGKCDPFGLFRRFRKYTLRDSLLILPRLYDFPPVNLGGKRKYQQGGVNLASSVGDSEEFFSLRDYRPGDPMRTIHWRSYAKKGTPVVKEFQDEYFSRLGLVLDTYPGNKPDIIFEEAVSVAASIAVSNIQQDNLMDLMFINDQVYRFTTGRGVSGVNNMLEILACVECAAKENISELETVLLHHATVTSGFICILLDWDTRRRQMIETLRAAGIPVMVYVISMDADRDFRNWMPSGFPDYFHILQAGDIGLSLQSRTREM
jgi:uncharacterized protein (DUF58 family)